MSLKAEKMKSKFCCPTDNTPLVCVDDQGTREIVKSFVRIAKLADEEQLINLLVAVIFAHGTSALGTPAVLAKTLHLFNKD